MESENEDSTPEEESKSQEPGLPPVKSQAYLKLRLEQLASTAQNIISDPEKNYSSLKILKALSVDKNIQIRKYALLTQLSVFMDILPGYRIRALTEEEKAVKVSKEVRNLRIYEESLVSSYQSYLKILTNQYRLASTNPARHGELRPVVAKCYSELMANKHNFNFADELFSFVARRLATTHRDAIYDLCADATVRLFKEDELGQSSLRMVQALTKSIKHKEYRVSSNTIRLFLHLKFNINVLESLNKKDNKKAGDKRSQPKMTLDLVLSSEKRAHISKKMKKRNKEAKVVEQEMREAEAEYSVEERSKVQSELLKNIFVIYFRILKHAASTKLFPVTLEGLSKFGHLINVDFFTDLLGLLKGVLRDGLVSNQMSAHQDDLAEHTSSEVVRCQLLCILTAFKLLTGQGEVLNLDLKDFYMFLYSLLPVAAHMTDGFSDTEATARPGEFEVPSIPLLVVDCVDALFFRNRRDRVPLVRAAAFFKRIVSIAYHFPHKTAAKLLVMAKAFVIKYPCVLRLLSSEEMAGDGEFAAMATDPDMANPFATSLFELPGLLHHHYDPSVRRAAQALLKATLARN
ncbi:hypothetical protein DSO57_1015372 [Entomophthora muscae]|uniref:Uncharacterized protein n=1 Tax=Entomophthora muscae TaxID=34485 RepID=A0ACC2S7K9_9FUNG|nr:hypothetical protein DSO57_1015372 [Entomophthora muscae]